MKKIDCLFERYPLFRYIPAILLLSLLFRTSSIGGAEMGWLVEPFDKIVHGLTYAFLGAFFALWFSNRRWDLRPFLCTVACIILCVISGALDEFHQCFVPGRTVSLGDVLADFVGGTFGSVLYACWKPWKRFSIFREESV